jgi:hypothetical protein
MLEIGIDELGLLIFDVDGELVADTLMKLEKGV